MEYRPLELRPPPGYPAGNWTSTAWSGSDPQPGEIGPAGRDGNPDPMGCAAAHCGVPNYWNRPGRT